MVGTFFVSLFVIIFFYSMIWLVEGGGIEWFKEHSRSFKRGILLFILTFVCYVVFSQTATWYSFPGKRTANGERFNDNLYTAAHKTYKFGTKLCVTNLSNGKQVEVTVNDRLPKSSTASIDLTKIAFNHISNTKQGRINVKIEIVDDNE